jgi:predicted ATPase/DNA-binding CsgD family transcriptional regulator
MKVNTAPGRLPSELTSFVGRRRELTEVRQRLEDSRLVTLTGIGGVGKTRLALRTGTAVRRAFRDSAWLVEFGDLTDSSMLAEVIAGALGILGRTNRPADQLLEEHLASRQMLLILDNCEHLLDAVADLVKALLEAAPGLKVLATSREPLNIDGESVVRVPPLTVPDLAETSDSCIQAGSDAITLFVERARSHVPGFVLTAENTDTVIRICQRLDGLPLPIELAAARMRTLSVTQILDNLSDRYRLLTGGRRATPSRQQTLRSSVDWSWDLCSPEEQRLWARLSVFAGSAQLDAIEGICTDASDATDIIDLVGSLVDKSIVIREEPGPEVRYRMLDTLREYGRSELLRSGEYDHTRRRYRDWYAQLVTQAVDDWVSANRRSWASRLGRDQANLREAMEYCFDESGEAEAGLLVASSLYPYWLTCGRFSEGRRWLDRASEAHSAAPSIRARAMLLNSVLAGLHGDTESAASLLACAGTIADSSDRTTALTHYASGYGALYQGQSDRAVTHFAISAEMFHIDADTFLEWGSLEGLGVSRVLAGDMERAVESLNHALAITATGEHPDLHAYPLWALAIALWQQGDPDQATAALHRGLEISRRGDPLALAYNLQVSAWIAADSNDEERAVTLGGAAEVLWRQLGSTILIFPGMQGFQDAYDRRVRSQLTAKQFHSAHKAGASMTRDEAAAFALNEEPLQPTSPDIEMPNLTKREREVAALVTRGLTNKAIAESLVISQRTAQGHVENILTKLGFSSRTQIATWVASQQSATEETAASSSP